MYVMSKLYKFCEYNVIMKQAPCCHEACKHQMPEAGLEPARSCPRGILSPLRLPIPPLGHAVVTQGVVYKKNDSFVKCFILKKPHMLINFVVAFVLQDIKHEFTNIRHHNEPPVP